MLDRWRHLHYLSHAYSLPFWWISFENLFTCIFIVSTTCIRLKILKYFQIQIITNQKKVNQVMCQPIRFISYRFRCSSHINDIKINHKIFICYTYARQFSRQQNSTKYMTIHKIHWPFFRKYKKKKQTNLLKMNEICLLSDNSLNSKASNILFMRVYYLKIIRDMLLPHIHIYMNRCHAYLIEWIHEAIPHFINVISLNLKFTWTEPYNYCILKTSVQSIKYFFLFFFSCYYYVFYL